MPRLRCLVVAQAQRRQLPRRWRTKSGSISGNHHGGDPELRPGRLAEAAHRPEDDSRQRLLGGEILQARQQQR